MSLKQSAFSHTGAADRRPPRRAGAGRWIAGPRRRGSGYILGQMSRNAYFWYRLSGLVLSAAVAVPVVSWAFQAAQAPAGGPPPPSPAQLAIQQASQQDRQKMLDLLHITSLRNGATTRDPQAPNFVNYDESKANPYPKLPDPLVLKNGKKVTTAKMWWEPAPPGNRRGFRSRNLWPDAQGDAQGEMGSDRHDQ